MPAPAGIMPKRRLSLDASSRLTTRENRMTTTSTTTPAKARAPGRGYLWAAIGLCLLGVAINFVQFFVLKKFFVPWYGPAMSTLGVLLLILAVARRRSVTRVVALVLVAAFAGFGWYFLVSLAKLPEYTGPAQAGRPIPTFQTTLADGRPFSEK